MSKKENRVERISFRLTPTQRRKVEKEAEKQGVRLSTYLQRKVLGETK